MNEEIDTEEYISPVDVAYLMQESNASFSEAYPFVKVEESYLSHYDFSEETDNEKWLAEEAEYISKVTGFPMERVIYLRDTLYTRIQKYPYENKEEFEMLYRMLVEIQENEMQEEYARFYASAKNAFKFVFEQYILECDDFETFKKIREKYFSI